MKFSLLLSVGVLMVSGPVAGLQAAWPSVGGVELPKAASDLGITLPDFQKASVADLSATASKALSGLQSVAKSSPAALEQLKAVQSALASGDTSAALASLTKAGEIVKQIPGAEKLLGMSKQLVSAWALKQGFDTSKISGLLGALQKGDTSALAAGATKLLGAGGLSTEQTGMLKGVLNTFGIDSSSAAGAVGSVKGLFGK